MHDHPHLQVFDLSSEQGNVGEADDLLAAVYSGFIKSALRSLWNKKSMDDRCSIVKNKGVMLRVNENFATGALKLVALSTNASVQETTQTKKPKESKLLIAIGQMFTNSKGNPMIGVVRNALTFPQAAKHEDTREVDKDGCLVAFWAVREIKGKGNAEVTFENVDVKVGSEVTKINVPVMVNTAPLKIGQELILEPKEDEPDAKRQKVDQAASSKASAKTKAKAKSKARGRGRGARRC